MGCRCSRHIHLSYSSIEFANSSYREQWIAKLCPNRRHPDALEFQLNFSYAKLFPYMTNVERWLTGDDCNATSTIKSSEFVCSRMSRATRTHTPSWAQQTWNKKNSERIEFITRKVFPLHFFLCLLFVYTFISISVSIRCAIWAKGRRDIEARATIAYRDEKTAAKNEKKCVLAERRDKGAQVET